MNAPQITKISLLHLPFITEDSYEVLVNLKNFDKTKHRVIVQVNMKNYEPYGNTVIIKIPKSPELATANNLLRIKAFIYDFVNDKIVESRLQEFVMKKQLQSVNNPLPIERFSDYQPQTSASEIIHYEPSNRLSKTVPVIVGATSMAKAKNAVFKIKLSRNVKSKSFVPLGVPDFGGNPENYYFVFDYSLRSSDIDELTFTITDQNGDLVYGQSYLKPVQVQAKPVLKHFLSTAIPNQRVQPQSNLLIPTVSNPLLDKGYTDMGNYQLYWEGFDNDGIFDSSRFRDNSFKATIIATKKGRSKKAEVKFSTKSSSQVDWVDVKINAKTKRIDATLRVNLKDGGAEGLYCKTYNPDEEISYESYTPTTNAQDPLANVSVTVCPWDNIPANVLSGINQPVIKSRTKSFTDLESLVLKGLEYYWGRNSKHFIAKNLKIDTQSFEFYMNAVNSEQNAMGDIELIYNTNGEWLRSGNPGSIKDPITAVGNLISRQGICYNVGYIKHDWDNDKYDGWRYASEKSEEDEFKLTSAHEIGHEILKKFGGTFYSYGHKGTVNTVTQNMENSAPPYPQNSEIDIMPYYPKSPPASLHKMYAAANADVLGLLWLTKIEIK
jgi:hypothetical protein